MKAIINGKLILKNEILENKIIVFDEKIIDITNEIPENCEVIDVKGFKTKEYIAKKKVFEDKFNLKITEIN